MRGANLVVYPGQTVAIVGESGSGKSTTAHAIIDLLPGTGHVTGGQILFEGRDITQAAPGRVRGLRGDGIGLVPQDPMSNLNPVWKIGYQVSEALKANGQGQGRRCQAPGGPAAHRGRSRRRRARGSSSTRTSSPAACASAR